MYQNKNNYLINSLVICLQLLSLALFCVLNVLIWSKSESAQKVEKAGTNPSPGKSHHKKWWGFLIQGCSA